MSRPPSADGPPRAASGKIRSGRQREPLVLDLGALSELITIRLRQVDELLVRGFLAVDRRRKFRSGTISTLALIVANPGISQNEIARATGVDKVAVGQLVNALEDFGWVVRRKVEDDKRRHALHATARGKAELDKIVESVRQNEAEFLAHVPAERLELLKQLLDEVRESCLQVLRENAAE